MDRRFPALLFLISLALCHAQVITTVASSGPTAAPFTPSGLALDLSNNVFFADSGNFVIREVTPAGVVSTVAGNGMVGLSAAGNNLGDGGPATSAEIGPAPLPIMQGVAVDLGGNLYFSDPANHRVRKVDTTGTITTVAGSGSPISGGDGGPAVSAGIMTPAGLAIDVRRNLYIADLSTSRIRVVNVGGIITTYAGNGTAGYSGDGGPAANAQISVPNGLAVDIQGNLYVAEGGNALYGPRIRKIDTLGNISTVAGNGTIGYSGDGGPATSAQFGGALQGIAVDHAGNIYVADYSNSRIRKINPSGTITTVAGTGQSAFGANGDGGLASNASVQPGGLGLDSQSNLYISDLGAAAIRKITFGATPPGISVSSTSLYFAGGSVNNQGVEPQTLLISSAGPPLSVKVTASTTSGGSWLGVGAATETTPFSLSVNPNNSSSPLAAGMYSGTITITPTAAGYSPVTVAVTLVLSPTLPSPAPVIGANSVLNGASFQPGVVPGAYLTIKGTNLASVTDTWNNSITGGQLPTVLDGVTVNFGGTPGYISFISPTQINVLVPPLSLGSTSVQVIDNGAFALASSQTAAVNQYAPAFFTLTGNQAIATRQDYTYALKAGTIAGVTTTPAKPGDVLILWGTGFGSTTPATLPGVVTPADKTYATGTPPTVTINNVAATVYGAALAPGYAGLYQVAIQVPTSLGNGDWPIIASIGGASSPSSVILSVHQ